MGGLKRLKTSTKRPLRNPFSVKPVRYGENGLTSLPRRISFRPPNDSKCFEKLWNSFHKPRSSMTLPEAKVHAEAILLCLRNKYTFEERTLAVAGELLRIDWACICCEDTRESLQRVLGLQATSW